MMNQFTNRQVDINQLDTGRCVDKGVNVSIINDNEVIQTTETYK